MQDGTAAMLVVGAIGGLRVNVSRHEPLTCSLPPDESCSQSIG
jgi:hypothetical protein